MNDVCVILRGPLLAVVLIMSVSTSFTSARTCFAHFGQYKQCIVSVKALW